MGNWFQDLSGKMSDAIPNEFSQLNGFSKFLPPPFNYLIQAPASLDRFGETYSNSEGGFADAADAGIYGAQAFMGQGGDPNKYGTGEKNWSDTLGQVGNFAGQFAGGSGGMGGSSGQASGQGSSGSFDMGSLMKMFGGSGSGSVSAPDLGSGNFIRGSAATGNPSTGGFDDNNFDIRKMFEAFQKMQTQPESDVYDPNAHAEMIKSRYPWIPQQAFQQWLASQPPAPNLQFAGQPRL